MDKGYKWILTSLLGIAVFFFWMGLFPQVLNYQEQNQLFLFTWDYLGERLRLPGGAADWLSEFLVQFFYWEWAGALVMAFLAVFLQQTVWRAAKSAGIPGHASAYVLTFIPSLLVLIYQGDVEVLLSYPVALILAVCLCPLFIKAGWHRLWLLPLGWWLIGPMILLPLVISVLQGHRWADFIFLAYAALVFYAEYRLLAPQYPPRDALFGLNYYRLVENLPTLQWVIPVVSGAVIFLTGQRFSLARPIAATVMTMALLIGGTLWGVSLTYDKDTQETLAYDYLIRHERYQEVIQRAEKYQPHNSVSACSVNFCLFMNRELLSRMDQFYQCGVEGLVEPSIRDNMTDITSAELLWMMGMPNITLQYYFDLQESIQNGRESGRFMTRIAEVNIVNGWYERAVRYLDILSHSLCYRKWALEKKALIQDEARVAADPIYAYIRQVRFKEDFITVYSSLDLMMAILYNQNKNNFMAGEYYTAWQRLKTKEAH